MRVEFSGRFEDQRLAAVNHSEKDWSLLGILDQGDTDVEKAGRNRKILQKNKQRALSPRQ